VLFAEQVGNGPPVVAVHGFTQTRRSWQPIVERLAGLHQFTLVDAPGHGGSAQIRAGLWDGARLLAETAGGPASYLGYSMGARLCLHLALEQPDLVDALVLVGVNPGIEGEEERGRRRAADEVLAERLTAEGVPAFVDRWLAQPLFSNLPADASDRDQRITNTTEGLAASLRLAGTGRQDPLWERLPELQMPVLLVAGELDDKFDAIARRAAGAIGPNAELVLIPGAGHACHLERPDAFCLVLSDFLADVADARH